MLAVDGAGNIISDLLRVESIKYVFTSEGNIKYTNNREFFLNIYYKTFKFIKRNIFFVFRI